MVYLLINCSTYYLKKLFAVAAQYSIYDVYIYNPQGHQVLYSIGANITNICQFSRFLNQKIMVYHSWTNYIWVFKLISPTFVINIVIDE